MFLSSKLSILLYYTNCHIIVTLILNFQPFSQDLIYSSLNPVILLTYPYYDNSLRWLFNWSARRLYNSSLIVSFRLDLIGVAAIVYNVLSIIMCASMCRRASASPISSNTTAISIQFNRLSSLLPRSSIKLLSFMIISLLIWLMLRITFLFSFFMIEDILCSIVKNLFPFAFDLSICDLWKPLMYCFH